MFGQPTKIKLWLLKLKIKRKNLNLKKREKLIPIRKQASLACKDLNFAKDFFLA